MKINYWDNLKKQIERGKLGLNTGIPFGNFTTLSNHVKNIQQGRYDLVFANTGVGKSAFINGGYIYGPIEFLQSNPNYIHNLEIIYYSLEIRPEDQIAKHIAYLIWTDYGILTTKDEILSMGNLNIPKEIDRLIPEYEEKLTEMQSKYIRFRSVLNPDFYLKDMIKYAEKRGKIIRDDSGEIMEYIPNDPSLITLIVKDHMGLINLGSHKTLKSAIDSVSKDDVYLRRMFGFSPLNVFQTNRSHEGMDRRDGDAWMPMLSDIKNTANAGEDAQTVIGIASPFYYGIENCRGFDISKYRDRYRLVKICKNRDGNTNLLADFLFIGEYGGYYQLPKADELGDKKPEELRRIDKYIKEKK